MAIELAKAYVQVVPSAKGIKGSLENVMSGESEAAGQTAGSKMSSGIVKAVKAAAVGAAIGKILADSLNAGAELQQSIGGIETLFGEASQTVIANAKNAFRTAGLSANEYMQTATSFAASLVSSLGGDTAEAAKIADQAIVDMVDNANKMGTDISSIQSAYQGFAKGQYQLLDNLKLGYGGTKTEMERLLQDATALSGVEYDISNLSDVYNAIHVIQEDLGITGTTAAEASETFSGSMQAMKASVQNLLGYLSTGGDIQAAVKDLMDSTMTFIQGNLVPMLGEIITNIPTLIDGIIDGLPGLIDSGVNIITKLVEGLATAIPRIIDKVPEIVSAIWNTLKNVDWLELGKTILNAILDGIVAAFKAAGKLIKNLFTGLFGGGDDNPTADFETVGSKIANGGVATAYMTTSQSTTNDDVVAAVNSIGKDITQAVKDIPQTSVVINDRDVAEANRKGERILGGNKPR